MCKIINLIAYPLFTILLSFNNCDIKSDIPIETHITEETVQIEVTDIPEFTMRLIPEEIELASKEEIDLIALVTMAEAEGESEEGKRLVIDTILNRVDSIYFPDTIYDVIYQKHAFEAMWNGRVDKCYIMDDIRQLVIEELQNRTNYDVVFFTAGHYGKYGKPMMQVGNHYFASYE